MLHAVKNMPAAVDSAFAYFSILPGVSRSQKNSRFDAPTTAAINALPLVGIVIGTIAGSAGYGIALITTPILGYATAFIAMLGLSGALHLDGFSTPAMQYLQASMRCIRSFFGLPLS